MANDDFPRGLFPINLDIPSQVHYYRASSGTDIYIGDPVYLAPTGYVTIGSAVCAGVPYLGSAVGFLDTDKAGLPSDDPFLDVSDLAPKTGGRKAGDVWIAVADDPNQMFLIQEDTGGTALALADVGNSIDLIRRTTVGNTETGWANIELDASTTATTTSGGFQILGLADTVNLDGSNNAVGDYAKWVVKIYHHQRAGGNAAVGIV